MMNLQRLITLYGCLLFLAARASWADAPAWVPVRAQSSLAFSGVQQGERFTGQVRDFDARVDFQPGNPGSGRIEATMRTKSIDTRNSERDTALAGSDWFDYARFPLATFRATALHSTPAGFIGDAELTIKGHAKHIPFPFTWTTSGANAVLDAKVTLDRLDYALGAGEWSDESIVSRKVDVIVHLVLAPASAPATPPPRR